MELNTSSKEARKIIELHMMLNDWIVNDKYVNYLLEFAGMNHAKWIYEEVVCYVLKEHLFDLLNLSKLVAILSFVKNKSKKYSSTSNTQSALLDLITPQEKLWNTAIRLDKHEKLCLVIGYLLEEFEDSLSHQTSDLMFKYLMELIDKCDHEETIHCAVDVLVQFPFDKYRFHFNKCEPSLQKLICFQENLLNSGQIHCLKHCKLTFVMGMAFLKCKKPLSNETCNQIFKVILELIKHENNMEIVDMAFAVLKWFPFSKYQPSLVQLINLMKNQLNTEHSGWDREEIMCGVIEKTLKECQNSLRQQTCDRMFDYLMKLFEKCEDEKMINVTWHLLRQLSFTNCHLQFNKYEATLQNLIYFPEFLNSEQIPHDTLNNLCYVVGLALKNCKDTLSNNTCDKIIQVFVELIKQHNDKKMLDMTFSVLIWFPFSKYQSSLAHLVDLMKDQLNTEHCEWNREQKLCGVMEKILKENKYSLSHEACDNMFDYIAKLFEKCKETETINRAFSVLRQFPFDLHQSSLLYLIDSIETQLNKEKREWNIQWKLCRVMEEMLLKCKHSLSHETLSRMFKYLMKLIKRCYQEDAIHLVCNAMMEFLLTKCQSSLVQRIESLENQLNEEQNEWECHGKLCEMIKLLLEYFNESLSKQTHDRIYEYLVKLITTLSKHTVSCAQSDLKQFLLHNSLYDCLMQIIENCNNEKKFDCLMQIIENCNNEKTFNRALYLLKLKFPYYKYHPSLLQLVNYNIIHLNNEEIGWEKSLKLCYMLKKVLPTCIDWLSQQTQESLFDNLIKLIPRCSIIKEFDCVWAALRILPLDKYQPSILQLINSNENKLNNEPNALSKHDMLCYMMANVLAICCNSLSFQTLEQIFNYLLKLIEKYKDKQTIRLAYDALKKIPFAKHQSLIMELIDSAYNRLNIREEHNEWVNDRNLCQMAKALLWSYNYDYKYFHYYSLSHETIDKMFDYLVKVIENCDEEEIIGLAFDALQQVSHKMQSTLIKVYQYLLNNLQSPQLDWRVHQNLSRVMEIILKDNKLNLLEQKTTENIFIYFFNYLPQCNDTQKQLSAILILEKLYLMGISENQIILLKIQLLDILNLAESLFEDGLTENIDFCKYQVWWCARWCVDNVIRQETNEDALTLVKLSPDRFGARNDGGFSREFSREIDYKYFQLNGGHPVRSSFAVSSGIYYYEVTIVTSGEMVFGWGTSETILNHKYGLGDDKNSIGYYASQKFVKNNSKKFNFPFFSKCRPGDVIGCLIDCIKRRFVFYHNRNSNPNITTEIVCGDNEVVSNDFCNNISFSSSPYFAIASLSLRQQCCFNFGQSPFKFAPKEINHFHEASGGNVKSYQLAETKGIYFDYDWFYWFKHSSVGNQVDFLYCDELQNKYDESVKKVEEDIINNREIGEWRLKDEKMLDDRFECIRWIQSIIEAMGNVMGDDKVDVMAQWIGGVIMTTIDKAVKAKLLELLYLQLQTKPLRNSAKHRNICIVLSHLIEFSQSLKCDFIKHIRIDVFNYLMQTFIETMDNRTLFFVLIALENLKLKTNEKKILQQNQHFFSKLSIWKDNLKNSNIVEFLTSKDNSSISYQLHFASEHFLNSVLKPSHHQPNPAALNRNDRTEHLKLSLDLMSARSDYYWQSVRSECFASLKVHYFEVVLVTSGPMSIGWSTKRTDLERNEVGRDQFSIGIDGYNQCVLHKGSKSNLKNNSTRWRAGDVIGCLIEVDNSIKNKTKKRFLFTLNGQPISYAGKIFSSDLPYYASVSLSAHQQVYINFGQSPFKYPPKKDFWDFYIFIRSRLPSVDFRNATITNAIITTQSSMCITGDNSFNYQPLPLLLPNSQISQQNIITTSFESSKFNVPSIKYLKTGCQLCFKLTTIKLLRFVCCNTITLCLDCLQQIQACSKCSKEKSNKETDNAGNPNLKCQLCFAQIETKLLQFACCNSLIVCIDCLSQFRGCPMCKRCIK